jgi:uncharacterized protein YjbJ (UPF0337 family)
MAGTMDKAKGRVKEAAGALTDDDKLRREGRVDQLVGKMKDATEKLIDTAKDGAEKVTEKVTRAIHSAKKQVR